MGIDVLLIIVVVSAIAGAVQATTGSGLALVAAPGLLLIDPGFVPVPLLVAGIAIAVRHAVVERHAIDRSTLIHAVVALIPGVLVGAGIRAIAPELVLTLVVAALVTVSAGALLFLPARTIPYGGVFGGFAGGLASILAGLPGPPLVVALQHLRPAALRATTSAYLLCVIVMTVGTLAVTGEIGRHELDLTLTLVPGVGIGLLAGRFLRSHLDGERFRKTVLIIALLSGIAVAASALR